MTSVHSEEEYARARAILDVLLDEIGDNDDHSLADVLDYLADQVKAYEDEHAVPSRSRAPLSDGTARPQAGRSQELRAARPHLGYPEWETGDHEGAGDAIEESLKTLVLTENERLLVQKWRDLTEDTDPSASPALYP